MQQGHPAIGCTSSGSHQPCMAPRIAECPRPKHPVTASHHPRIHPAAAAPPRRCKDCKTNNCFRNCKAKCPAPVPRPPQVNGDRCRRNGRDFGRRVNRLACDTTRLYCNGGQRPAATRTFGIGAVTLQQVGVGPSSWRSSPSRRI
jgi:hypothetical protein